MDTIPLQAQLSNDWTEILDGIQNKGFWTQVSVELARPNLIGRYREHVEVWKTLPNDEREAYKQTNLVLLVDQIEENNIKYQSLFNPTKMKILWSNIKMKEGTYSDGSAFRYPSKGAFLCQLIDCEFPYGLFDAYRGSCGYTSCSVGRSYGRFYLGGWDDIYKYSLTDYYRKIIDREGFRPKERLD